jgi:phosphoenolpyruvate synthase/pyruvate phosphate dikinase
MKSYFSIINFILAINIILSFNCCSSAQTPTKYLTQLHNKVEFDLLSGNPLSSKYGEVNSVKVVYDIENKKIYFLNSSNYKYHHGFCSKKLGYNKGLLDFNKYNYAANSDQRIYLLGNINYYQSLNSYVMDLSPADLIQTNDIEILYHQIIKASYIGNNLVLLLNTSRLINQAKAFNIPTITPEKIYKNQSYQAISLSKCYGYLRFVTAKDLKQNTYSKNDVLVMETTPNIIPHVAGIISSEFQTPLSHLSILGRNRNIPIMAYKEAFNKKELLKYKNKYVQLIVSKNGYVCKTVPVKGNHNKNGHLSSFKLQRDLSIDTLVGFNHRKKVSAKSVGNKAKNFATLTYLSSKTDFRVPENAFAIPFFFYEKHIENSRAGILIEQLLIDYKEKPDNIDLKKRLKKIRKTITKTPIDKNLLNNVTARLINDDYQRFRFRSSTNAEDMNGFGGAGLYTSKTGIIGDSTKTIEKAIKKVWASLWNIQAFAERDYFHIKQENVAMGILVHRAFPNEIANGVAITKNIYRESNFGYVVNVQVGNESVVDPKKGVVCDQVICYESGESKIYSEKDIIEVITKSSLNNNQLIMTDAEIIHLVKQLEVIKRYYFNRDSYQDYNSYGLDIEFKLDTEKRILYIKQVRYYNG